MNNIELLFKYLIELTRQEKIKWQIGLTCQKVKIEDIKFILSEWDWWCLKIKRKGYRIIRIETSWCLSLFSELKNLAVKQCEYDPKKDMMKKLEDSNILNIIRHFKDMK